MGESSNACLAPSSYSKGLFDSDGSRVCVTLCWSLPVVYALPLELVWLLPWAVHISISSTHVSKSQASLPCPPMFRALLCSVLTI